MELSTVRPFPTNPRIIPDKAVDIVAESIRLFGWQQPLVVDTEMVLVAGHTRLLAARKLGLRKAPVVIAESLTQAEIDAYRIADNRTHDFTSWDYDGLKGELGELDERFDDVLAVDEWPDIPDEEDFNLDIPDDVRADAEGGFIVVLTFEDKKAAAAVQQDILGIEGVLDVRYRR
jgi:hypothetical protein